MLRLLGGVGRHIAQRIGHMNADKDPIVAAYSRNAVEYAGRDNLDSCWGSLSASLWPELDINPAHRLVVDVGCGPGETLAHLAKYYPHTTRLLGVEPADNMRYWVAR